MWLVPNVPRTMGLHGARMGDNHGSKVGVYRGHNSMAPNITGPNGVHNGPTSLVESPLGAICFHNRTGVQILDSGGLGHIYRIDGHINIPGSTTKLWPQCCNPISTNCRSVACSSNVQRASYAISFAFIDYYFRSPQGNSAYHYSNIRYVED